MNDLHATVPPPLGVDHEKLTDFHNGRQYRLTDGSGEVFREILT